MPRQKRAVSLSKIYHVIIRGNEKKDIFHDNADRFYFLKLLDTKMGDIAIYAFCLMSNHVHLLLYDPSGKLSIAMHAINISYAMYYNKKYDRIGHLFQDRFLSENIEDENHLLSAVRYIHNNPIKANICSSATSYRWSSARHYLQVSGQTHKPQISVDFILNLYSSNRNNAIKKFSIFSQHYSEEQIMDIDDKPLQNVKEAIEFINNFTANKGISLEDLSCKSNTEIRNILIRELRSKSNLSDRKIADIIGINRNIVQRTK